MSHGRAHGFTLLELVIAMALLGLMSLGLYGVVSLGATTAGAGERKTEQARRFRIATSLMVRQLRSAAPVYAANDSDEEGLDGEVDRYFLGEEERLEFATASPQGPYSTGLALVAYWLEDGVLMMAETPYFLAFGEDGLGPEADAFTLTTPLLYDIASLTFEYQRSNYDTNEWQTDWDASEEDDLPAGVRILIEPATPDGPVWEHEVPLFVAVFNEVTGEEDFRRRPRIVANASRRDAAAEEGDEDDADLEEDDDVDFDDDDEDFEDDDE